MNFKELKQEINKLGCCAVWYDRFKFYKRLQGSSDSNIVVEIKNNFTKEVKKVKFSYLKTGKNPFNYNKHPHELMIRTKVNKLGYVSDNKYKRFKFVKLLDSAPKSRNKRVLVENIKSGDQKSAILTKIYQGQNPFYKRGLKSWIGEIKETVNKVGCQWSRGEKFVFVKVIEKTKRDDFLVEIKERLSGQLNVSLYYDIKSGRNPFRKEWWLNPVIVKENIVKWGLQSKDVREHYSLVKFLPKKTHHIRVLLKSNFSGILAEVNYDSIRQGVNPFRCIFDFDEKEKSHPKVMKAVKKMGIEIISHEKFLIKSKPDLVCRTKSGKYFIIEIKSDKKKWSRKKIKDQEYKYNKEGRLKFGLEFVETIILSLNGKYGISLDEFKKKEFS